MFVTNRYVTELVKRQNGACLSSTVSQDVVFYESYACPSQIGKSLRYGFQAPYLKFQS